jgi:hypothetical protein
VCQNDDVARKRTEREKQQTQDHRARNRALVSAEKLRAGACSDCGLGVTEDTLVVFDWDHRDPLDKSLHIQDAIKNYGAERLLAELSKCDLVCANCHRLRTRDKIAELGRWWEVDADCTDQRLF